MRATWVQVLEDGIILKVWQTTALQIAAHHPKETHSASFERSTPRLLICCLTKRVAVYLR